MRDMLPYKDSQQIHVLQTQTVESRRRRRESSGHREFVAKDKVDVYCKPVTKRLLSSPGFHAFTVVYFQGFYIWHQNSVRMKKPIEATDRAIDTTVSAAICLAGSHVLP